MVFEVKNELENRTMRLKPSVALYSVCDFMGLEMPGLAILLHEEGPKDENEYVLTVSFGEFIGIKNAAYIDVNNCRFANELLKYDIAKPTDFTKKSGFCTYPLWVFKEEFLREIGGEPYKQYSDAYDKYMCEMLF